jgi:hypothetical protein
MAGKSICTSSSKSSRPHTPQPLPDSQCFRQSCTPLQNIMGSAKAAAHPPGGALDVPSTILPAESIAPFPIRTSSTPSKQQPHPPVGASMSPHHCVRSDCGSPLPPSPFQNIIDSANAAAHPPGGGLHVPGIILPTGPSWYLMPAAMASRSGKSVRASVNIDSSSSRSPTSHSSPPLPPPRPKPLITTSHALNSPAEGAAEAGALAVWGPA